MQCRQLIPPINRNNKRQFKKFRIIRKFSGSTPSINTGNQGDGTKECFRETYRILILHLAIAMVLPFVTGQVPEIGLMLLPMYISILLCGFMCGWKCGLTVGFIAPLLRSVTFGMPPMIPMAVAMAFELAV